MDEQHPDGGHGHHHMPMKTLRAVEHMGHKIEVETDYLIRIDGKNYKTHIMLGEDGQITTHAIPYRGFKSMTDLIKALIELYPDEFKPHSHES